jgi:hypothetical protein
VLRKEEQSAKERVRCQRIEEDALAVRERAAALQTEVLQADNKCVTRSDTELRLIKEERDKVQRQLDQVTKHHQAAERVAAEAKSAQRSLEVNAADER